ncbi:hypothetical protein BSK20_05380 [SR1 bacterium human oral taxon HOT-345]|nr:hypothetical protein BSK20_05380 [SR1 bacterium human oral taxon HOT-345]
MQGQNIYKTPHQNQEKNQKIGFHLFVSSIITRFLDEKNERKPDFGGFKIRKGVVKSFLMKCGLRLNEGRREESVLVAF